VPAFHHRIFFVSKYLNVLIIGHGDKRDSIQRKKALKARDCLSLQKDDGNGYNRGNELKRDRKFGIYGFPSPLEGDLGRISLV
jgi:hypothetical protein